MAERRSRFRRVRDRSTGPPPLAPADGRPAGGGTIPRQDGAHGTVAVDRGVSLAYHVAGDGPQVVIVPTAGNRADFDRLVTGGRCVVFYDVRSRGRSDTVQGASQLGFSIEVTDLEAIRQSFGIERFSVLGWSYHGGVAAAYAIEHPERIERMVLAATIPTHAGVQPAPARKPLPHQLAHLDQLEAAGLRGSDPAALCRAWREIYVPLLMSDPGAYERMAPVCDLENEHPWNVARSLVHVFAQLNTYDWRPLLRGVPAPTLIVYGEDDLDPIDEAEEWVRALPEARLLRLAGVGQFPWVEAPDAFFGAVNRFLAGESI